METIYWERKLQTTLAGIFFIIAAVSSVVGLKLYDPILHDSDFLVSANEHYSQIVFAAINELILAVSAIGTALSLFPYLKRYNESLGLGYLSFRKLEVICILIGTLSLLAVLSLSDLYSNGMITGKSNAKNMGQVFIVLHDWAFIIGTNFFLAINTFIYSFTFFKSGVIPKKLSTVGITASVLIMTASILELFGIIEQFSVWGILLAVPIALYEMTLAVWLIVKGIKVQ